MINFTTPEDRLARLEKLATLMKEIKAEELPETMMEDGIHIMIDGSQIDKISSISIYMKGDENDED